MLKSWHKKKKITVIASLIICGLQKETMDAGCLSQGGSYFDLYFLYKIDTFFRIGDIFTSSWGKKSIFTILHYFLISSGKKKCFTEYIPHFFSSIIKTWHCEWFWFSVKLIQPNLMEGLVKWHSGEESACQCRRHRRWGFYSWVRKIPWRRKCQLTLVFLPVESTERGACWATGHGVTKSWGWLSNPVWMHSWKSAPVDWLPLA